MIASRAGVTVGGGVGGGGRVRGGGAVDGERRGSYLALAIGSWLMSYLHRAGDGHDIALS